MKPSPAFLADLAESRDRVSRFAAICRHQGVQIWQHPEVVRPDESTRHAYADDGDLLVMLRVEHKAREIDFTDASDFPYDSVIVDEAYKIDRITTRPFWYVTENRDRTRAAVVSSRTIGHWTKTTKYDAAQQRDCEFYVCPKRLVRFCGVGEVF